MINLKKQKPLFIKEEKEIMTSEEKYFSEIYKGSSCLWKNSSSFFEKQ